MKKSKYFIATLMVVAIMAATATQASALGVPTTSGTKTVGITSTDLPAAHYKVSSAATWTWSGGAVLRATWANVALANLTIGGPKLLYVERSAFTYKPWMGNLHGSGTGFVVWHFSDGSAVRHSYVLYGNGTYATSVVRY